MEDYGIGNVTQNDDGTFNVGARKKEEIEFLIDQLKVRNRSKIKHVITKRQNGFYTTITAHEMLAILTTYSFLPDLDEFEDED